MGAIPTKDPVTARPDFISPQLAAAMSHPTRVHAMSVLLERSASPRQVAEAIDERLNNVTYHINQLLKLGCIELVRTERVRGGRVIEHFYRATKRLYFDDEAWQTLNEKERLDLVGVSLRIISRDINEAMAAGTFFGDDNAHLCRLPMIVDPEGWEEISDVIERTTEALFEVEERVAERASDGSPADIHAKVELMQFRSPPFERGGPPRDD
ncbi:MAG: helix-turn-helix transcriptional regulator [Actinobacteria bacterium]|nr:helix-turn-helix transcriptional regulator [Actinomycetota bacterium]